MKTNIFSFLTIALLTLWSINASLAQGQFCETFDNGIGAWEAIEADVSVVQVNGNPVLDAQDEDGISWITNDDYSYENIGCGEFKYDYTLLDDGFATATVGATQQIYLISDLNNPLTQLRAIFVLNEPILEMTGTVNITVPLYSIGQGEPLPSNEYGMWEMNYPALWNDLLSSFVGVAFKVDVVNSAYQTEHFQVDNFCYYPGFSANGDFNLSTDCDGGDFVVIGNSGSDFNTQTWNLYQTTQPGQTSGGIQVGPSQTGGTATFTGLDVQNYYYLELETTDLCTGQTYVVNKAVPYHEIASIFHLEDESGNTQNTFCYGENVFLNGTASYGENNYFIDIQRRPFPDTGEPWGMYSTLGWESGTAPIVNLSEAFAALNYDFEPGFEYRVKLAVQNTPECVNWEESLHTFVVECCEGYIDPKFSLERKVVPGSELYSLEALNYSQYQNTNVEHTWTVYSSPNLDGGPYTFVDEITGSVFYYEVPEGLCYFVIHSLESLCGSMCYGQSDCINAGEGFIEETCDLCGPFDCKLLDGLCLVPQNLKNECIGRGPIIERLKWNAIFAADGYVVEITWNDDACCETALPEETIEYEAINSSLDINTIADAPVWDCLRWRVRPDCQGGEDAWSEYMCFDGCISDRSFKGSTSLVHKASLYPNPTNDRVQITFQEPFTGTLQLADKTGRLIQTQEVTGSFSAEVDLSDLPTGLYWITTKNGDAIQTYKLVKQ